MIWPLTYGSNDLKALWPSGHCPGSLGSKKQEVAHPVHLERAPGRFIYTEVNSDLEEGFELNPTAPT